MHNINAPLLPDEVVWLEIFKALLVLPKDIEDGESYFRMADKGLDHFKQRFRNDETMVSR